MQLLLPARALGRCAGHGREGDGGLGALAVAVRQQAARVRLAHEVLCGAVVANKDRLQAAPELVNHLPGRVQPAAMTPHEAEVGHSDEKQHADHKTCRRLAGPTLSGRG